MSLSRAARAAPWEAGGASRVFVFGHCPCCPDGVAGVAVAVLAAAVAVAVAAAVLAATVVVLAAASSRCMAAERASTLSAAESMAVWGEGEGGSCYLALGRCRVSSHISPAISSTARHINCTFSISPSPSPSRLPDPPRMCHHRLPRRPRHTTHKHLQKCMYYIYYTILYLLSHTRSHTIAYSLRLRGCSRRHRDTRLPVAPGPRRRKRRPCCKPLCLLTLRT